MQHEDVPALRTSSDQCFTTVGIFLLQQTEVKILTNVIAKIGIKKSTRHGEPKSDEPFGPYPSVGPCTPAVHCAAVRFQRTMEGFVLRVSTPEPVYFCASVFFLLGRGPTLHVSASRSRG